METAKAALLKEAVAPFHDPDTRDYIENVRRSHDQIIDNINLDQVIFAGYDTQKEENADRVIATFREFIEEIRMRLLPCASYMTKPTKTVL